MAKQKPSAKDKDTAAPAEGYTVLARRYRPQTFADLVGQEPVCRALANAIQGGRVAHAYLFTGARGVGKTSTARILARSLNCAKGPTPTPCGDCEICKSIATGDDVDVLEIDGASDNGVDDVRELRGNVQYRPQRARFKIYIIDEVHMLSKGAFNALLKTLEEPPPHVKFIFATTEVDKVPITILSRCQRFDLAGISMPRIVERLKLIVEKEGLQADSEALELVARRAGGSMRDAQSLLDQLLAFGGDRLTSDQVHHLLGTAGDERVLSLADAVIMRDAKKALELLDEACVGGLQLAELCDQLMTYWRDLMIVQQAGTEGRDLSVPTRHHDTLRRHLKAVGIDAVLAGLDVLSTTRARLKGSAHARTLVEMALVRLTRLADLASLSQLSQWLGQPRDPRAAAPAPAGAGAARVLAGSSDGVKKNDLTPPPEATPTGPRELTEANLAQLWREVGGKVGVMHAAGLNRGGRPAILGPNTLVLRFPPDYNTDRAYCEVPERVARVEAVLNLLTGQKWTLQIEQAAQTAPASAGPVEPTQPKRSPKEEAQKIPLVKRAVEIFGATIQRADEDFGTTAVGEPQRPAGEG